MAAPPVLHAHVLSTPPLTLPSHAACLPHLRLCTPLARCRLLLAAAAAGRIRMRRCWRQWALFQESPSMDTVSRAAIINSSSLQLPTKVRSISTLSNALVKLCRPMARPAPQRGWPTRSLQPAHAARLQPCPPSPLNSRRTQQCGHPCRFQPRRARLHHRRRYTPPPQVARLPLQQRTPAQAASTHTLAHGKT